MGFASKDYCRFFQNHEYSHDSADSPGRQSANYGGVFFLQLTINDQLEELYTTQQLTSKCALFTILLLMEFIYSNSQPLYEPSISTVLATNINDRFQSFCANANYAVHCE